MKTPARHRAALSASLVILFSLAFSGQSQSTPPPSPMAPAAEAIAEQLRTIATAGCGEDHTGVR